MLDPALTSVLSKKRDHLNQRFEQSRREYPQLDAAAFFTFLDRTLVPLATEALRVAPDRLDLVVLASYEVGLSLVGQGLAGPGARVPAIEAGLRHLCCQCMALVAEQPKRALSALSNALHHLVFAPGANTEHWVADVERVLPCLNSVEQLLAAGQVAAWRAGLAQYRTGALEQCQRLPEPANRVLFRVPEHCSWADTLQALWSDRWHDPARQGAGGQPRWAGGFRGFGGLFGVPPRVAASGEHVIVNGGQASWLLIADAFGATFHKATPTELEQAGPFGVDRRWSLQGGELLDSGRPTGVVARGELTSAVSVAGALVATFSQSHDVLVLAHEGP